MVRRTDGRVVCLFLALVSLVKVIAPSIACAQQIVGTVSQLSGTAQIQRGGATISVAQGIAIELNDRLTTSVNSSATATLANGTTLTLAEHTNLTFDQNVAASGVRKTELNLVEGGLRSIVSVLQPTETFEVHTPNAVAAVRGTDFDTTYIEEESALATRDASVTRTSGCAKESSRSAISPIRRRWSTSKLGTRRPCRASCRHSTPDRWESPARRDRARPVAEEA